MQLGRTLCFGSDAAKAAVKSEGGLHVVDLAGKLPATFHALPGEVHDLAGVGGELWAAAGRDARLFRFGRDHQLRGEQALWGGSGVLRVSATGESALWSAPPPAVVLATGTTQTIELGGEVDCVIPLAPTRWVVCRRDRVTLRDPRSERWTVTIANLDGRVVDGAVLFGGRTVALVVARGTALAQLIVLGLADGALHRRLTLTGIELVRFAAARGLALMRSGAHLLILLDLRFGEVLKERREREPVIDAAIDPNGLAYMTRFGDGATDIAVGTIRELIAEPGPVQVAVAVEPEPASSLTGEPEPEPEDVPAVASAPAAPPRELGPLHVLSPRPVRPRPGVAAAAALLESYREVVGALTGAAIAAAWNDGRLHAPIPGELPFHAEVAGLRVRTTGLAPDEVATANREVDTAFDRAFASERALGTALSPLAALAADLGLAPVAQLLVLVVAAPELWVDQARLYRIVGAEVDRGAVTAILAPRFAAAAVARELEPDAPLIAHRVIAIGAAGELTCDPIVVRLLAARPDDDIVAGLAPTRLIPHSRELDQLALSPAVRDELVRRLGDAPATPNGRIVVRGRIGTGRHTLLATLACAAGRRLGVLDATAFADGPALAAALARAALAGLLPCVDHTDRAAIPELARIFDAHRGPLALCLPLEAAAPLAPGFVALVLPPSSLADRLGFWHAALAEHALAVRDPGELAERFTIGPGGITRACAAVAAEPAAAATDDAAPTLAAALRARAEPLLVDAATPVDPLPTWANVVLPADVHDGVLELIARIKHRRTVHDRWQLGDPARARGVTALFHGAAGTGKSLVTGAIASELGLQLWRVELARGDAHARLAAVFDAIDCAGAIIQLVDADVLIGSPELTYVRQRLASCDGVVVLSTHTGAPVERALRRQLTFRLMFPFPDEDAREQLWRMHLPPTVPRDPALGPDQLAELAARYALSGGAIRIAITRAAFLAAEEGVALTADHLDRAVRSELREVAADALSAAATAESPPVTGSALVD